MGLSIIESSITPHEERNAQLAYNYASHEKVCDALQKRTGSGWKYSKKNSCYFLVNERDNELNKAERVLKKFELAYDFNKA